ncbi:hypothetical protein [Mesorhizobium sp. 43Arga]
MPGIVVPGFVQLSMNAGSFISIWINTDHHHEATPGANMSRPLLQTQDSKGTSLAPMRPDFL